MKRKMIFLVATAVFLLGLSASAMAYLSFYSGHVVNEVPAPDLEHFTPWWAGVGAPISFTKNSFPVTGAAGAFSKATRSDLQVAYFIRTSAPAGATYGNVWTDGPQAGQTSGSRQWNTFNSSAQGVFTKYGSLGTAQGQVLQSGLKPYINYMDKGRTAYGSFGWFIQNAAYYGEKNTAPPETTGYVDSYLYYYATPNSAVAGTKVATLRTYADGHTDVLGASPVPIPAPVMLLGSGLMSLVGIRRKLSKTKFS